MKYKGIELIEGVPFSNGLFKFLYRDARKKDLPFYCHVCGEMYTGTILITSEERRGAGPMNPNDDYLCVIQRTKEGEELIAILCGAKHDRPSCWDAYALTPILYE